MHPEIEKFYTDANIEIVYIQHFDIWARVVNNKYITIAGYNGNGKIEYLLDGQWYPEKIAVRMVRLKAFL
jgi:hypothetical protein